MEINCVVDGEDVILPEYKSVCASGMDLRAWKWAFPNEPSNANDFDQDFGFTLHPMRRVLIKTGLHIELPPDTEAQIRPRSGLALKHGITVLNTPGTIDEDYRGDIGVILVNLSEHPYTIHKNDRIAQIVFQKVEKYDLNIVDKLSETIRGEGGFNSTGKR